MAKGSGSAGRPTRSAAPGGDYGTLVALNKARRGPKPGAQTYSVTVMGGGPGLPTSKLKVRAASPEEAKAKALKAATKRGLVKPRIIGYSYEAK
jgi:hypothetical protein